MRSPVIVVGRFALKFAQTARGRASNLYEARLYRSVNSGLHERKPAIGFAESLVLLGLRPEPLTAGTASFTTMRGRSKVGAVRAGGDPDT
jgi:hypothetical protein